MTLPQQFYATTADWNRPVPVVAQFVLDTIVATFEANAEYVDPLPDRRIITIGTVSVDAPLLAVMYGSLNIGLPGNELTMPMLPDAPRTATFNIELWRSAPMSSASGLYPADAGVITADAKTIMVDSHFLLDAAAACDVQRKGVVASVGVNEPSGDMQGVSMLLQIAVP